MKHCRSRYSLLCAIAMCCVAAALLSHSAAAQVLLSPALAEQPEEPEKELAVTRRSDIVRLSPSKAPVPALKYRFWPAPHHRENRSASPFVSRAILMVAKNLRNDKPAKEFAKNCADWQEMSLDELPLEEVRKALAKYATQPLAELGRSENAMKVEYDLHLAELSPSQVISTVLPELSEMRELARLLSLRAKLAAAEGRWDDFVDDCRLGFRLSGFAAHNNDFLVSRLVGFAIASMMMENIHEAIQHPGCPNLYWALATLPDDYLFEIRGSIEFESVLQSRLFDSKQMGNEVIGAEASRRMIRSLCAEAAKILGDRSTVELLTGTLIISMADQARTSLEDSPVWKGRTDQLSDAEAVLRSLHSNFENIRDAWVKWALLPPELTVDYAEQIEASVQLGATEGNILLALAWQLTPATQQAMGASQRTRQQKHFLMTLEALRMSAAEFGELPRQLTKLQPVPAWNDALAMKPFGYTRNSRNSADLVRTPQWEGQETQTFRIILESSK